MNHAPNCKVTKQRIVLTGAITDATNHPADHDYDGMGYTGSEGELLRVFDVLKGIVAEYVESGDQELQECNCGVHNPPDLENGPHADDVPDEALYGGPGTDTRDREGDPNEEFYKRLGKRPTDLDHGFPS